MAITPVDRWWKELGILLVVCVPFLFWGIGSISFLDPDEGMYGSIALEMAQGGDWITPRFNGVRYLEKPPLQFWLSGLTISAFGPSEWAVRLWSALPAFGISLLLWRMGSWLYGRPGGLLAAVIFASGAGVFRYVRVAATDFLLVFSLTLAMYGFIKAALAQSATANSERRTTNRQLSFVNGQSSVGNQHAIVLFYIGMALGVISKGLIGLVFPLVTIGLFLAIVLFSEQWRKSRFRDSFLATIQLVFLSRYAFLGILIFLSITVPWHVAAGLRNDGFFDFYIMDNQILRYLNVRSFIEDDVPIQTLSFLIVSFIWFFPWSLFLLAALCQGFPRSDSTFYLSEPLRLLVVVWALGFLAFFSFSSSKLEHYSLPAIPALSLMVGGQWARVIALTKGLLNGQSALPDLQGARLKWWLGITTIGCSLVGAALLLFSDDFTSQGFLAGFAELNVYYRILKDQGLPFPFESLTPFINLLKGLGVVLVVGFPLSYFLLSSRRPKSSFVTLVAVAGSIAALVFKLDLVVELHHSARPVARALLARLATGDRIVHEGSLEYSGGLPFYTGRRIYVLNGKRGDLDFGSRYSETRYLFLEDDSFARMWQGEQRVFLVTRSGTQKSVLKNLPTETIFVIGQYGSHWLYTNRRMASNRASMASSQSSIVNSDQ